MNLPITQFQAILAGLSLIAIVVMVNIINAIFIQYRVNKVNQELSEKLIEISKQLLVQSGYLKDDRNG